MNHYDSMDSQRVALVTGATSGVGLAIAQRLTREGYSVAVHSRASTEAGEDLAASLPRSRYFSADLLDDKERSSLIDRIFSHFGRLDLLVNNAGESGVIPHADLLAATTDIWHRLYELHVVAPWRLHCLQCRPSSRFGDCRAANIDLEHCFPRRRATQGCIHPLCRQQGGADPRDPSPRQEPRARHPGQRHRPGPGGYPTHRILGRDPRALDSRGAHGPKREPCGYCGHCLDAHRIPLCDRGGGGRGWWIESAVRCRGG